MEKAVREQNPMSNRTGARIDNIAYGFSSLNRHHTEVKLQRRMVMEEASKVSWPAKTCIFYCCTCSEFWLLSKVDN